RGDAIDQRLELRGRSGFLREIAGKGNPVQLRDFRREMSFIGGQLCESLGHRAESRAESGNGDENVTVGALVNRRDANPGYHRVGAFRFRISGANENWNA